jgi:hypothetical protein
MKNILSFALIYCGIVLFTGCGDATSTTNSGESNATASVELLEMKTIDVASLPKVGVPITPVGFPKLSISPPENWGVGARPKADDKFLVRFMKEPPQRIPGMELRANPEGKLEGFSQVNAENAESYAEAVQATLKKPKENARAMLIGKNAFVRYVKTATYKNEPMDVQVLVTIQNGQPFVLEMHVPEGKIPDHRDAAYSVAANMSFDGAKAETTEEEPAKAANKNDAVKTEEKAEK